MVLWKHERQWWMLYELVELCSGGSNMDVPVTRSKGKSCCIQRRRRSGKSWDNLFQSADDGEKFNWLETQSPFSVQMDYHRQLVIHTSCFVIFPSSPDFPSVYHFLSPILPYLPSCLVIALWLDRYPWEPDFPAEGETPRLKGAPLRRASRRSRLLPFCSFLPLDFTLQDSGWRKSVWMYAKMSKKLFLLLNVIAFDITLARFSQM